MPRHVRARNRNRYLYLIRHGEYVQSEEHFGGVLTPRGEEQARSLVEPMKRIPVDAVYSSNMHRAYQTAQILRDEAFPEMKIRRTPVIRERIFPNHHNLGDLDPEKDAVAMQALEEIGRRFLRPSRSERHEVFVCHGNLIRALVTQVIEAPVECWINASIANCGVTQILCRGDGRRVLISFNERGHLPYALRLHGCGD
jgi:serine/threonine-protein phosphatase PGAM5